MLTSALRLMSSRRSKDLYALQQHQQQPEEHKNSTTKNNTIRPGATERTRDQDDRKANNESTHWNVIDLQTEGHVGEHNSRNNSRDAYTHLRNVPTFWNTIALTGILLLDRIQLIHTYSNTCTISTQGQKRIWQRRQKKFDSTLGFPGEGPPPSPTLGLIGMNFRGLVSRNRLKTALIEARRCKYHVVLAQEHNITKERLSEFENISKDMGFTAIIGACESGGAAIFIDTESGIINTNQLESSTHLNGRLAIAKFSAMEQPIEVASIYIPVGSFSRGAFLTELKGSNLITGNTILQGDFNYVPDVLRDVRYTLLERLQSTQTHMPGPTNGG